ncbi:hypothetical protein C923_04706 [Plasmodium falciparum UGT5.1]|uniref:Uncharacterized protein n=2 Tax=Plasmodium falciparum TaxID=5833 RepID=A0A024X439_PLAFC|nr:hypothetical protein PFMC_04585 [Plasmodium falciparum CAMP/Malaysia]EWC74652.1 hypothetical protein C923_04706 [Plasmodium falciparum UGT5.1]
MNIYIPLNYKYKIIIVYIKQKHNIFWYILKVEPITLNKTFVLFYNSKMSCNIMDPKYYIKMYTIPMIILKNVKD